MSRKPLVPTEAQKAREKLSYREAAQLSVLATGRMLADAARNAKNAITNNPATALLLTGNTVAALGYVAVECVTEPHAREEDKSHARQAMESTYAKSFATLVATAGLVAAKCRFNEKYDELAVQREEAKNPLPSP